MSTECAWSELLLRNEMRHLLERPARLTVLSGKTTTGMLNVCAITTMTYPLLAKSSAIDVYALGSWPEPGEKIRTGHRVATPEISGLS